MIFIKALTIGFLIAAPVGPIGLMCMQRTLQSGLKAGFATGLGAASADALYGFIGAFGFAALTSWLVSLKLPLSIAGAIFLTWMGLQLIRTKAIGEIEGDRKEASIIKAYASTALLTLMNPLTIISFLAVYATLMANLETDTLTSAVLVAGIFSGSALWWLTLSGTVALIRHKVSPIVLQRINYASGSLLILFALFQLSTSLLN